MRRELSLTHVRYDGLIHDWGLLNPISRCPASARSLLAGGAALKKRLS